MTFNFPKTLLVLLVCLAFVGQAMASTLMSYHMMSMKVMNDQEQSQDMSMMDHSKHKMANDSSSDSETSEDDCCVQACSCFTGSCSSLATLLKYAGSNPIIDLSSKIPSYLSLAQSQQSTSLYRPPILS
ncbi:CopL family metal-binding regulatory protein [Colwellia sp. PAMC 20917]|uniref:CopL family metal-binding regulatory protein n=1 Tax=Colwellia sp. PAMC 20917 TaxID=1816218 RepID=UPI000A69D6A7|nr:CopL family metal-binding regulatory protein [Colwellia sp. PAMC 20917]